MCDLIQFARESHLVPPTQMDVLWVKSRHHSTPKTWTKILHWTHKPAKRHEIVHCNRKNKEVNKLNCCHEQQVDYSHAYGSLCAQRELLSTWRARLYAICFAIFKSMQMCNAIRGCVFCPISRAECNDPETRIRIHVLLTSYIRAHRNPHQIVCTNVSTRNNA